MEKVLVTGAGGYIGSILVPKLLEKGFKVKALDRFFFGANTLSNNDNLEIIKEDSRKIKGDIFVGVTYVIDLAAISNDPSGELFQEATYQINYITRKNNAIMAKKAGVKIYILPSSCSIYGFQDKGIIVDETWPANPLTTYAKANEMAEKDILKLADDRFTAVVLRLATVFGLSPRMRFDLAINGMSYGAVKNHIIPLMRDGTQWRPMVHVHDVTDVMCLLLEADPEIVNSQIFNVGSNAQNFKLAFLAEEIIKEMPFNVEVEWYGDPDHRSYKVNFDKIERVLNWKAQKSATDGAREIYEAMTHGDLEKTDQTITLDWYKELTKWHKLIKDIEMYEGIIEID